MDSAVLLSIAPADAQTDAEALLALHAPELVIVNFAGRRVLGREAFSAAMVAALASPLRDVTTTVEVIDVRLITADTAIVSCLKTIHDGRPSEAPAPNTPAPDAEATNVAAPDDLPTTGALSYVVTRIAGAWRIALAQTTPIIA